jgi:arylsulfatase A-like enzyme
MTGRFAMHHTIVDWIPPGSAYGLPLNETTMAQKMKEAGYATAASGKCECGSADLVSEHRLAIVAEGHPRSANPPRPFIRGGVTERLARLDDLERHLLRHHHLQAR